MLKQKSYFEIVSHYYFDRAVENKVQNFRFRSTHEIAFNYYDS